jgi:hypothetical protein
LDEWDKSGARVGLSGTRVGLSDFIENFWRKEWQEYFFFQIQVHKFWILIIGFFRSYDNETMELYNFRILQLTALYNNTTNNFFKDSKILNKHKVHMQTTMNQWYHILIYKNG